MPTIKEPCPSCGHDRPVVEMEESPDGVCAACDAAIESAVVDAHEERMEARAEARLSELDRG